MASVAAQCSSLTICILKSFQLMVESPLLQTRRTCIAIHMMFNKKCYVEWRPHVSMDIAQQTTQGSTMSQKFHKKSDSILKGLKVAHENLLGMTMKCHM